MASSTPIHFSVQKPRTKSSASPVWTWRPRVSPAWRILPPRRPWVVLWCRVRCRKPPGRFPRRRRASPSPWQSPRASTGPYLRRRSCYIQHPKACLMRLWGLKRSAFRNRKGWRIALFMIVWLRWNGWVFRGIVSIVFCFFLCCGFVIKIEECGYYTSKNKKSLLTSNLVYIDPPNFRCLESWSLLWFIATQVGDPFKAEASPPPFSQTGPDALQKIWWGGVLSKLFWKDMISLCLKSFYSGMRTEEF